MLIGLKMVPRLIWYGMYLSLKMMGLELYQTHVVLDSTHG
jgi:hypothetical protein